ncbi:hypothetical protein AAIA72_08650 [Hahella sp. SMD15-11]|uniref:DUF4174 domain-containing protein n=1 Tax=Thermohahella caldifontis TaxID=3142973 RepID=A0AB39UR73_9GAMM
MKPLLTSTLAILVACTPAPYQPQIMTSGDCQLVWHGESEAATNTCPLPDRVKAAIIVLAKAPTLEAYQQQMAALESFDFEGEQAILALGFTESILQDGYHLSPREAAALLKGNAFTLMLMNASGTVLMQSHQPVSAQALVDTLNPHP